MPEWSPAELNDFLRGAMEMRLVLTATVANSPVRDQILAAVRDYSFPAESRCDHSYGVVRLDQGEFYFCIEVDEGDGRPTKDGMNELRRVVTIGFANEF